MYLIIIIIFYPHSHGVKEHNVVNPIYGDGATSAGIDTDGGEPMYESELKDSSDCIQDGVAMYSVVN